MAYKLENEEINSELQVCFVACELWIIFAKVDDWIGGNCFESYIHSRHSSYILTAAYSPFEKEEWFSIKQSVCHISHSIFNLFAFLPFTFSPFAYYPLCLYVTGIIILFHNIGVQQLAPIILHLYIGVLLRLATGWRGVDIYHLFPSPNPETPIQFSSPPRSPSEIGFFFYPPSPP